jgi:hypothetical protein
VLGQQNILVIWHLFGSFPNKFVMDGVTIESPIESPMVSPTILNSSGSRVQDRPYRGYLYPPKTNYISRFPWPGTTLPLKTRTSTSNCEGLGELPSHYLLPESQSCEIEHLSWRFLHETKLSWLRSICFGVYTVKAEFSPTQVLPNCLHAWRHSW